MNNSRRSFAWLATGLASLGAANVSAQFGGRHGHGDASMPSRPGDSGGRSTNPALADPVVAIERELPSLRVDLNLTAAQAPLFDSFEREVREAADAGRLRAHHLSAFRTDDGSTVTAETVLTTFVDDDGERADAMRQALERKQALFAALTPDQRKQFDRRIIEALREPLGTS